MPSTRFRALLDQLPAPEDLVAESVAESTAGHQQARELLSESAFRWTIAQGRLGLRDVLDSVRDDRVELLREPLTEALETSAVDLMLCLYGVRAHASVTPAQHAAIIELVRLDVPFQRNIAGLRIVQRRCLHALFDAAETVPAADRIALIREISDAVGGYFDEMVDAIIEEFLVERQRMISRRLAGQREMVTAVIAGDQVEPELMRQTLGVQVGHSHLGLIIWRTGGESLSAGDRDLEQVAHKFADRLGAAAPLIIGGHGKGVIWAWVSRAAPFSDSEFGELSRTVAPRSSIRVAVGTPAAGQAGFRRTHLAAVDARRVALAGGPSTAVVLHRDVALLAALTEDLERARWLVAEELGALAGGDGATAELRRTALTFLQTGGSLVNTAARMHVHRNTVVYRIRRASELLGRPLTERTLETHAALLLAVALAEPDAAQASGRGGAG